MSVCSLDRNGVSLPCSTKRVFSNGSSSPKTLFLASRKLSPPLLPPPLLLFSSSSHLPLFSFFLLHAIILLQILLTSPLFPQPVPFKSSSTPPSQLCTRQSLWFYSVHKKPYHLQTKYQQWKTGKNTMSSRQPLFSTATINSSPLLLLTWSRKALKRLHISLKCLGVLSAFETPSFIPYPWWRASEDTFLACAHHFRRK